jgi:hypothetical protein
MHSITEEPDTYRIGLPAMMVCQKTMLHKLYIPKFYNKKILIVNTWNGLLTVLTAGIIIVGFVLATNHRSV